MNFGGAELLVILAMLAPIIVLVAVIVVVVKLIRKRPNVGTFNDPSQPPM
ncbi:MAG: hypothetical protein ABIZ07_08475 [Dermatophilaceae bacterium]